MGQIHGSKLATAFHSISLSQYIYGYLIYIYDPPCSWATKSGTFFSRKFWLILTSMLQNQTQNSKLVNASMIITCDVQLPERFWRYVFLSRFCRDVFALDFVACVLNLCITSFVPAFDFVAWVCLQVLQVPKVPSACFRLCSICFLHKFYNSHQSPKMSQVSVFEAFFLICYLRNQTR